MLRTKCLTKHFSEGNVKGGERARRRRKQLLDKRKGRRLLLKLKYEATDRTQCRIRFGRDYRPNFRNTHNRKNES